MKEPPASRRVNAKEKKNGKGPSGASVLACHFCSDELRRPTDHHRCNQRLISLLPEIITKTIWLLKSHVAAAMMPFVCSTYGARLHVAQKLERRDAILTTLRRDQRGPSLRVDRSCGGRTFAESRRRRLRSGSGHFVFWSRDEPWM
ncbi:hypothetical protein F2P81_014420 [Scophthalmus maximus]|uniref:Uncharacterized protein n=1 Tax=Scophthalmus maximus TaxID=52904 RepID=A0A6A4STI8_SCOMX|nr:hypothetical protein F2P81_014420 [Scophthalmus maximus]